jgi:hypothetical protein
MFRLLTCNIVIVEATCLIDNLFLLLKGIHCHPRLQMDRLEEILLRRHRRY